MRIVTHLASNFYFDLFVFKIIKLELLPIQHIILKRFYKYTIMGFHAMIIAVYIEFNAG